ncbi:hypothetical protein PFBG_06127 [Plasmodium falciparum 7G8]|uniref:Rifin n=1 Tax=Plasmodium falciparum (isolate 7G8) TaxID=57266 RepID=W7EZ64_PLAF8|nr:hypothetical protein PFBG_06127 [Plasmodium falciparum 7G8]
MDKLEKELAEKFVTLQTDIQNDAIPTCVCEKSLADKTEKFCHNCGYGLGSVAPNIGLLGGPGIYVWKIAALATAKELAEKAGALAGEAVRIPAAIDAVIAGIKSKFSIHTLGREALKFVIDGTNYNNTEYIFKALYSKYQVSSCLPSFSVSADGGPPVFVPGAREPICRTVDKLYLDQRNFLNQSLLRGYIQKDLPDCYYCFHRCNIGNRFGYDNYLFNFALS